MTPCYCKGTLCGRKDLDDGRRKVHFDARIDWGLTDVRIPWTGSYDFGSFACVAAWGSDRSGQHDGRVLSDGIDPNPVAVTAAPTGETDIAAQ